MRKYAEILNGKIIHVGECADDLLPEFAPPLECVVATEATGTPEEGGTWNGSTFTPPVVVTPVVNYPAQAQALLTKSDVVMLRCYEQGMVAPSDWVAYREALREVIRGNSTTIPSMPEYPS